MSGHGTLYFNGRVITCSRQQRWSTAFLVRDGKFVAVGTEQEIVGSLGPITDRVDLRGRTVIPGLFDSHIHGIRQGLNHAMELRWDRTTSLADGLLLLRDQARRTPPGHWVRVVGGWTPAQMSERRHPTLQEINEATGDTPAYVLHLYDYAILNRAALRALGITKDTPDSYLRGRMARDTTGEPTGLMVAAPNALILYSLLNLAPKLDPELQALSSRHFFREMNRLGVTSFLDAGGGFMNYPDDYGVIQGLHGRKELSVRIGFSLFAQKAGKELEDFERWTSTAAPGQGDDRLRILGAGEMLRASAYDFEDFILPRPDLSPAMEDDLMPVIELLARKRWPFRFHATYDESATRILNVLETVNRIYPLEGLRWILDHGETISPRNIDRVAALGGGISVQNRIAYQEKQFLDRYGPEAANDAPPLKRIIQAGVPLGNGTDATRVSSYNPWHSIAWTTTGRGAGGLQLIQDTNRLDRESALRIYTDNGWFSREENLKGRIEPGLLADFAVLSADYLTVPDEEIRDLHSVLTVVGGEAVHGEAEFSSLAPPPLPELPEWSPVRHHPAWSAP